MVGPYGARSQSRCCAGGAASGACPPHMGPRDPPCSRNNYGWRLAHTRHGSGCCTHLLLITTQRDVGDSVSLLQKRKLSHREVRCGTLSCAQPFPHSLDQNIPGSPLPCDPVEWTHISLPQGPGAGCRL